MSKLVGFRVDPPWPGAKPFVEGRVSATRDAAQWIIDNLNERGFADMELLRSKAGDLYLKEKWKPEEGAREAKIQSVDHGRFSSQTKTDQPPLDDEVPF
jgi:hypothetical protein